MIRALFGFNVGIPDMGNSKAEREQLMLQHIHELDKDHAKAVARLLRVSEQREKTWHEYLSLRNEK